MDFMAKKKTMNEGGAFGHGFSAHCPDMPCGIHSMTASLGNVSGDWLQVCSLGVCMCGV